MDSENTKKLQVLKSGLDKSFGIMIRQIKNSFTQV